MVVTQKGINKERACMGDGSSVSVKKRSNFYMLSIHIIEYPVTHPSISLFLSPPSHFRAVVEFTRI